MKFSLFALLAVFAGVAIAQLTGVRNLQDSVLYLQVVTLLLALGLYGSTYGIDLADARRHLKLILAAVTIGVVLKAAIIGGTMWVLFDNPLYVVVGVAVAQIDPLSVAALSSGSRLSKKACSVLSAWASFDDPVTTLLSVYCTALAARYFDLTMNSGERFGYGNYFSGLAQNIVLILVVLIVWQLIRKRPVFQYALVGAITLVAVERFLMLGQAVSGLVARPPLGSLVDRITRTSLVLAACLLGMLLVEGVDLVRGITLGVATFSAQIIVGFLLTYHLNRNDRIHLAFAQQNGITAIILAMVLEAQFDGVVAVVAPAVITVNVIHYCANRVINRIFEEAIDLTQSRQSSLS